MQWPKRKFDVLKNEFIKKNLKLISINYFFSVVDENTKLNTIRCISYIEFGANRKDFKFSKAFMGESNK